MPTHVKETRMMMVGTRLTPALRSKLETQAKGEGKTLSTVIYEACIAAVKEKA